ncbi:hypothetical protein AB0I28_14290 [Phytomonospora sp. NPDC050363]|uniref:hypothetical protein n=1 Tax=Phytomonospora sp. NPDC050363 TaxID=3155642 RepID=UPI0033D9CDB1
MKTEIERRKPFLALVETWYSDDNAFVRQKMRPGRTGRIVPPLGRIVRDGAEDGTFTSRRPELTAHRRRPRERPQRRPWSAAAAKNPDVETLA